MDINRRKKIIHRANYRGIKEADLLLGGFAKQYVMSMSEAELDDYEELLEQRDHDIYGWLSGELELPKQFDTKIFARLKAFRP